jgi:hypothetical protein
MYQYNNHLRTRPRESHCDGLAAAAVRRRARASRPAQRARGRAPVRAAPRGGSTVRCRPQCCSLQLLRECGLFSCLSIASHHAAVNLILQSLPPQRQRRFPAARAHVHAVSHALSDFDAAARPEYGRRIDSMSGTSTGTVAGSPRGLKGLAQRQQDESTEVTSVQMQIGRDGTDATPFVCIGLCCGDCSVHKKFTLCTSVTRCLTCEFKTQCCGNENQPCSKLSVCCCECVHDCTHCDETDISLGFSCGCFSCNCWAEPGSKDSTCLHTVDSATFGLWDGSTGYSTSVEIVPPPPIPCAIFGLHSLAPTRCSQGRKRRAMLLSTLSLLLLHWRLVTPCKQC